jgi:outer membrane protein
VRKKVVWTASAVLAVVATTAPAFAQGTPAAPPQPQAQAAAQAPATAPFVTPGTRVDLSIQEAVQRARDKNIDIGVARLTPRLTDFSIVGLEASYHPNLTSTTTAFNRQVQFPRLTTQGLSRPTPQISNAWSAGVAQNLWRGGGNYSVNWTNQRLAQQSTVNLRNPQFTTGLVANFTQPLLRGFKIDATRAAIMTNRLQQANDEITVTSTTESTEANVRNAYWDLVFAIQSVEAAQNSLGIANTLVQQNQQRVEIGTLAPIDVTTAKSEAASRRLTLVQAQATVRTAELALKRLIVSGTDDPLWTSSINPVDRPATTAEPINVEAAVARALRERTDLQQSRNNLKVADINLQNQVDQTRPQLNLTATYGLNGLGGPYTTKAIDPITGLTTNQNVTIASGYLDAIRNIVGFDAPQFSVGFTFSYPIGMSSQQATVARTRLSKEQTEANVKALELQVATDVTNAALTVQSSLESVQAAATARQLAKEKLDAAQSKSDVGMATNYEVVQAQRDFVDAQNNELRAILNYRKALVNFETAQTVGTRGVSSGTSSGGTSVSTSGVGTTGTGASSGGTGGTGGSSGGTGASGGSGGPGGV